MIHLDDPARLRALDAGRMLELVADLPRQLRAGWELAMAVPLPSGWTASAFDGVVIAGMGSSAIGASLVAALTAGECPIPSPYLGGIPFAGKRGVGAANRPFPFRFRGRPPPPAHRCPPAPLRCSGA